jgi:transaldolase
MLNKIEDLQVKIFADGADFEGMISMSQRPFISGLTTNPTLMRKAGVNDYTKFAKSVLEVVKEKSISFEIFSDDFEEMKRQALIISSWGSNVFVKIPITNSKGISTLSVVKFLTDQEVKVNVTALMTLEQVASVATVLNPKVRSYVSIFAGRIADTGRDPIPIMVSALNLLRSLINTELIWASPRELLNVVQANSIGCHIITATNDILKKLDLLGFSLEQYSLDTVKMFYQDAIESNFIL